MSMFLCVTCLPAMDNEALVERLLDGYWSYGMQGDATMVTFHPITLGTQYILENHYVSDYYDGYVNYTRDLYSQKNENHFIGYSLFHEKGTREYEIKMLTAPSGRTWIRFGGVSFWTRLDEITLWDFQLEEEGIIKEEFRPFDATDYNLIVALGNQTVLGEKWHKTGVYFIKYTGRCRFSSTEGVVLDPSGAFYCFESDGFYPGDSFYIVMKKDPSANRIKTINVVCNFGEDHPDQGKYFVAQDYGEVPENVQDLQ